MRLEDHITDIPDFPRPGIVFKDITPLFLDAAALRATIDALAGYALERKVIPVSPSTLHAYLLVILLGFKGLQIEEHAREVMAYCAQLGKDFSRFKDDFELVGTHIGRAQSKYAEAEKRLGRFETKLERAADSEIEPSQAESVQELPRALDAA